MKLSEKEMRENGFVRYNELDEKPKKEAHDRFAWDFVNERWSDKNEEQILEMLSKHWFKKNGGTYLGTH